MKEERFPHTSKLLRGRRLRVAEGASFGAMEESAATDCGGQSGDVPEQRIGADQHSPAQEVSLLTCRGGKGLGAEAQASEVRSQGKDWGWLCKHSLKGASAPQLAGRESGKNSGPAEEARDFSFPLSFLVREETGLRAPLLSLIHISEPTRPY